MIDWPYSQMDAQLWPCEQRIITATSNAIIHLSGILNRLYLKSPMRISWEMMITCFLQLPKKLSLKIHWEFSKLTLQLEGCFWKKSEAKKKKLGHNGHIVITDRLSPTCFATALGTKTSLERCKQRSPKVNALELAPCNSGIFRFSVECTMYNVCAVTLLSRFGVVTWQCWE